jgi:hypothetical protein
MSECDVLYSKIYKLVGVPCFTISVETGCFPYSITKALRNLSATSIVLSKEIRVPRITLAKGSMVTQTQTY